MDSLWDDLVCLWLTSNSKIENIRLLCKGEVTEDYARAVPDGVDVIEIPMADYLMLQGSPFSEEKCCDAISAVRQVMNGYNPDSICCVRNNSNPRIQYVRLHTFNCPDFGFHTIRVSTLWGTF